MANEQIKNGVVIAEINGIKYFKLQSKYPGDYTKNCGLLGNEIDENFYFLRSKDISGITFEDKKLVATRVDETKIEVDMSDVYKEYKFELDRKSGELVIRFPDGHEERVAGFLVEGTDAKVATDSTLEGNGSSFSPLGLSSMEKTGTYSPIDEIVSKLPTTGKFGQRVIVKDNISNYGCLYNYDGVRAIINELNAKNSKWRVPSREDWAELLDSAEECADYRKHNSTIVNDWFGKDAGARAKSTTEWLKSDRKEDGKAVAGEDNLPSTGTMGTFHVLPVGECESIGIKEDDKKEGLQGFGKSTTFWTSSKVVSNRRDAKVFDESNDYSDVVFPKGERNIYTRTFAYNTRMVKQESSKPDSFYSLRLVRDVVSDDQISNYEEILTHNVKCVQITNEETKYSKVWTSFNIGFTEPIFSGVSNYAEWSAQSSTEVFYIAEWDGKKWLRRDLKEGDSVVIINGVNAKGEKVYNHEWRVSKDGQGKYKLVDCTGASTEDFDKEVKRLDERISAETATRVAEISALTIEKVDVNDDDVREAYKLVDKAGEQHGELIKIYKDKAIDRIERSEFSGNTINPETGVITPGTAKCETLLIVYKNEAGKYNLVEINLDELFKLNAGDGIEFKDGKIHVKIDSKSDKFLNVGESGVTLNGVEFNFEEIADAVGLSGDTENGWAYVPSASTKIISGCTTVSEALNIIDFLISNAQGGLDAEIKRAMAAEEALSGSIDTLRIDATDSAITLDTAIKEEKDRATSAETFLQAEIDEEIFDRGSGDTNIAQVLGLSGDSANGFTIEFTRPEYIQIPQPMGATPKNVKTVPNYKEIIEGGYWDFENKKATDEWLFIEISGATFADNKWYQLVAGTSYVCSAKTFIDAIKILDNEVYKVTPASIQELSGSVITIKNDLSAEVTRSKAEDIRIEGKVDAEIARAKAKEDELHGQDIKSGPYDMTVDGIILERENGDPVGITFNGNFGTI